MWSKTKKLLQELVSDEKYTYREKMLVYHGISSMLIMHSELEVNADDLAVILDDLHKQLRGELR